MKTNDSLSTLVSLRQAAQSTEALSLVGATVAVNGANAQLTPSGGTWTLNASKPATATISIADSTGQNALYRHPRGQFRPAEFYLGRPRQ